MINTDVVDLQGLRKRLRREQVGMLISLFEKTTVDRDVDNQMERLIKRCSWILFRRFRKPFFVFARFTQLVIDVPADLASTPL